MSEAGNSQMKCWICDVNDADSREHKVLKARLDFVNHNKKGIKVYSPNLHPTVAHGTKSNSLKFDKILCHHCNGAQSQTWDKAYLDFVRLGIYNPNFWRHQTDGDWNEIPIQNPPSLAKYYCKNIGCRLIEKGFTPPIQFRDYLLSKTDEPPFSLYFVADYEWLDKKELSMDNRYDFPSVKFNYVRTLSDEGYPDIFGGLYHEGPYGVFFIFDTNKDNECFTETSVFRIYQRRDFSAFYLAFWKHLEAL